MSDNHWAWDVPTEEFYPLGNEKMEILKRYVFSCNWTIDNKYSSPDKVIKKIENDRCFASKVFTVFKTKIQKMLEDEAEFESIKIKNKMKEKKRIPIKQETEVTKATVIDFASFKQSKFGS